MKNKNVFISIISFLFITFIAYILYAANVGHEIFFFKILKSVPMGDKLAHIVLIGTLAFLVNLLLQVKTFKIRKRELLLGSLIVFGLVTVEEFTQIYIPTRSFDLVDLMANYIGIGIASWLNFNYLSTKTKLSLINFGFFFSLISLKILAVA